jgi:hypothetical protein
MAKITFENNEEVGYHGRIGKVVKYDGGGYIVYFSDVDNEEWIDEDELIEQNY